VQAALRAFATVFTPFRSVQNQRPPDVVDLRGTAAQSWARSHDCFFACKLALCASPRSSLRFGPSKTNVRRTLWTLAAQPLSRGHVRMTAQLHVSKLTQFARFFFACRRRFAPSPRTSRHSRSVVGAFAFRHVRKLACNIVSMLSLPARKKSPLLAQEGFSCIDQ